MADPDWELGGKRSPSKPHDTKRDNPKRYIVFGDSLSIGVRPHLDSPPFSVYANSGWSAGLIAREYTQAKWDHLYKKEVVSYFIWAGTNNSSANDVKSDVKKLVSHIRSKNKNARIYLGTVGYAVGDKDAINKAIRSVGDVQGVTDTGALYKKSDYVASDTVHLTTVGYRAAASLIGNALSSSPTSQQPGDTSGTSAPQAQPGSFLEVKKYIKPEELHVGQVFNPPLPTKKLYKMDQWPNARGFCVRDPLFQKMYAGENAEENWLRFQTPYGFRFLYNPSDFTESYSTEMDGDPIRMAMSYAQGVIPGTSGGLTSMTFSLFLSRFEDRHFLKRSNYKDYYPSNEIDDQQREDLLARGTQADLEYIFRMCNGDPQRTWTGMTSDWGYLLPTMSVFSMGRGAGARRIRGFITAMGWEHLMFVEGMIPVYTQVNVSVDRILDAYWAPQPDATSSTGTSDTSGEPHMTWTGQDVRELLPSDYKLFRSPEKAVAAARAMIGQGGTDGKCLGVVGTWYGGMSRGIQLAHQVWTNAPSWAKKYPKDTDAPFGALVIWNSSIGSGAGHIAISIGNGKMITTGPTVKEQTIKSYSPGAYLGWMPPFFYVNYSGKGP